MRWKVPPGYLAKTESLFLLIARGPKDAETPSADSAPASEASQH